MAAKTHAITVRGVGETVKHKLRTRAAARGRSLDAAITRHRKAGRSTDSVDILVGIAASR